MKSICVSCGKFAKVKEVGTCTGPVKVCRECYNKIAKDFNLKLQKRMAKDMMRIARSESR